MGSDATGVVEETQLEGVSKQFVSLLLNIRIKPFRGDPLNLNEWIKAIEKKRLVYGLTDKEIILLAFETAVGAPSDFIQKRMLEGPGLTWAQMKEELQAEYTGEPSALEAMRSLAEVRQKEDETVVELGERIRGLLLLAYPQEDIRSTPVLQAQLADCYVDALRDEEVKKEVLKAEPENVTRAVHLARRNKNFLERVRRHSGQKKERISRPTWGRAVNGHFPGGNFRSVFPRCSRETGGRRTRLWQKGYHNWYRLNQVEILRGYIWCCNRGPGLEVV